jgi:flagellar basal body P-ring formation protein FlgA
MKQVSNSLLTPLFIPFTMSPYVWAPRDNACSCGRHFTPFFAFPRILDYRGVLSLGFSCPPRSSVRSRLGEGRIRNLFHGLQTILFLLLSLAWTAPATCAADPLVINLKEDVALRSGSIYLKDIADLRGPDAGQLEKLALVDLGSTPAFGDTVFLGRQLIGEIIEKKVGRIPADSFAGASAVQIRLQGRQISEEEIASLLKTHLLHTTSWNESEFLIRSIGNAKGIEIPPEGAELNIVSKDALIGQKNISVPVEVRYQGKSLRSIWVTAEVVVRAELLTATTRILPGKVIAPEDVAMQPVTITDLRTSYYRNPEGILGKVSRRIFSAGEPLTCDSFTEPMLVKTGETVRLRLERDGIVLTSLAKAEQDGKLGQMIRVRNIDYSTLLRVQVTGRAEVRLQ